jgi:hypothetical protein
MRVTALIATICALATLCATAASANTLAGRVKGVAASSLSAARVRVSGAAGEFTTLLTGDGEFSLSMMPAGKYQLETEVVGYFFEPLRVEIASDGGVRAAPMYHKEKLAYPLVLAPHAQKPVYFKQHPPVNVLNYLKSPMVIMMIVMGFIIVVLPKMMDSMDPAEREELSKMSMSNLLSGKVSLRESEEKLARLRDNAASGASVEEIPSSSGSSDDLRQRNNAVGANSLD